MARKQETGGDSQESPPVCLEPVGSGLLVDLGPGVLERDGAVEDQVLGRRVGVGAEVAHALELHGLSDGNLAQRRSR